MLRHCLLSLHFTSQPLNPQPTSEGMLANETVTMQEEEKCFSMLR